MVDSSTIATPLGSMNTTDFYRALGPATNNAMATAGGKYGQPDDQSPIYLGQQSTRKNTASADGKFTGSLKSPMFQPYAQARMAPMDWDDATKGKFITQGIMNKVPGFDVNMGMPEIMSAWDDLIKSSYAFNSKDPGNPRWTPQDVLDSYSNGAGKFGTVRKGDWEYDVATGEKVKYVGPLSKTTTNTTVDTLTREDALALAKNSMSQMLGRAPTNGEVANYLDILNGYSAAHPGVSTTTTNIDPETGESRDSSTVNTGGTSAAGKQALIEEQMQKSPEYGAYQAATTYYNAFAQMVQRGY